MEEKRIIMLGNSNVGKTSIVLQYTRKEFKSEQFATLAIDFAKKETKYKDISIELQIFDTNGSDKFTTFLPRSYYRKANGILLVCSIDDKKSFTDLNIWIENLKENCDNKTNVVIVVNKIDLDKKLHVLNSNEFPLIHCSAKSNLNIDNAFNLLIEKIYSGDDFNLNGRELDNFNNIRKVTAESKNSIESGIIKLNQNSSQNETLGRKDPFKENKHNSFSKCCK